MIAFFIVSGGYVAGFKEHAPGDEYQLDYVLRADYPAALTGFNWDTQLLRYNADTGEFYAESKPVPDPPAQTPEQIEIEQLKARLAASDQLLADNSETTQFILEQLIANGVIV